MANQTIYFFILPFLPKNVAVSGRSIWLNEKVFYDIFLFFTIIILTTDYSSFYDNIFQFFKF